MVPRVPALRRVARERAPGWMAACRGAALGLAVLCGLNLLDVFVHATSSVQNWFCDLAPLTQPMGVAVLAMAATALLLFAMHPSLPGPVWMTSLVLLLTIVAACGRELWHVSYTVPQAMQITAMARPLSVVMLMGVAGIGIVTGRADATQGRASVLMILITAAVAVVAFATAAVQGGGLSDPIPEVGSTIVAIPGEAAGAGQISEELKDRLRTAAGLVRDGAGQRLLLIGATGAGPVDPGSTLATELSASDVSPELVELVGSGADSVSVIQVLRDRPELADDRRVIIVAHWYQLSRLRLLARRAQLDATVIAAEQSHALFNQNVLVAKEVAALLRDLAGPGVQFVRSFATPEEQ